MRSASLASIVAIGSSGCAVHSVAPPSPQPIAPTIDLPSTTPPDGSGRVIVDVDGDPAKVSRVVESTTYPADAEHPEWKMHNGHVVLGTGTAPIARREELLCVTPCVLDLRQGAHTFVFTSTADPTRTSTADVVVTPRPIVVRHALGREKPATPAYGAGEMASILGGSLVLIGGLTLAGGLVATRPEDDPTGKTTGDPKVLVAIGLVTLVVGLATGSAGLLTMSKNRSEHQPGATTQWALP